VASDHPAGVIGAIQRKKPVTAAEERSRRVLRTPEEVRECRRVVQSFPYFLAH